ncbi:MULTISPECIES: hypothetical protein [Bacillus]|jgi:hypothetical protein|uniref:Uncharacterized protein n=2 Tax=Bacillus pseudomycoides TaxID=64104 RepID=A0ABD6T937_9BACI|nr:MULTISPECIES: hypothetical protein [Bacillus cereus group]EEM04877.1 hypothetical protein bmyco0002_26750 [Bacillus pseudomycoides]EEM10455.1 hypothetical protein bmyco0003_28120 [Bacillus pseudomycoides]KFN13495.1 hypothetical protein DJ94_4542 [Bacillus pseudomycoides]MBJ8029367.1 hypothetical protein [Bacillus cereus group sp. N21]MCR8860520.1 hypothetical protein [Bacillus pseudomycoides]
MKNKILICRIDSIIEEEIDFLVNNQKVTGFNASPQEVVVNKEYEAEIDIFVNDALTVETQKEDKFFKIENIANGSYILFGKMLENNVLDVGFFITSDLLEDYKYLEGQYVYLQVDRLQLSFD